MPGTEPGHFVRQAHSAAEFQRHLASFRPQGRKEYRQRGFLTRQLQW
ncbi:MAG: hypothetical protein M1596_02315 [Firmicutes bacterium]|nr:hypothetical protein [Bacillota bacterium]